jgi:hypothetical protein
MNNSIRLALAGLALLTSLASVPSPAHAVPICENLDGWGCSAPNATQQCSWLGGGKGWCKCDPNTLTWGC